MKLTSSFSSFTLFEGFFLVGDGWIACVNVFLGYAVANSYVLFAFSLCVRNDNLDHDVTGGGEESRLCV